VTAEEIDHYMAGLDDRRRAGLEQLRRCLRELLPDATEGISYGMPAFMMRGKTIAGFAAFTHHLSYLPHSGSVLPALEDELDGYTCTKGSLHIPIDEPLPKSLVARLVETRLNQLGFD